MKVIDCRDDNTIITMDTKILSIEYISAKVFVRDNKKKNRIEFVLRLPYLYIYYQSQNDTEVIQVAAPQTIVGQNERAPLTYDYEKLITMVTECSEVYLDDKIIKISNCLVKEPPITMKYSKKKTFYFHYETACEKEAIEEFVIKNSLIKLLKDFKSTNDMNVIKAFYELISEGKGETDEN